MEKVTGIVKAINKEGTYLTVYVPQYGFEEEIAITPNKWNNITKSYTDEVDIPKQNRIKEFYKLEDLNFNLVIGEEFEYYYDITQGKLYHWEIKKPTEVMSKDDLTQAQYSGEIVEAEYLEQSGLWVLLKVEGLEKPIKIQALSFNVKTDDGYKYRPSKEVKVFGNLNISWTNSSLYDGELLDKTNIKKLIGVNASIMQQRAGTTIYYQLSSFDE